MTERIKKIFKKLYDNDNTSKDELAKSLNVSSKTIENTISDYKNEIIYDKKLKRYRYINLLPSFIDYSDLFYFFTNSISNQVIKYDFFSIQKKLNSLEDILVISTTELSSLTQMLVKCKVAINNNCILKIKYKGNKKFSEDKYIRPIHIISTGHIFYLYASYDKRNSKDIGKYRSFAINAIESIEVMEFTNEATLKKEIEGNAYGIYDPEKFVILTLDDIASRFFRREGIIDNKAFSFISENSNGSTNIKMFYNAEVEIVNLLQKWLSHISIEQDIELKEKIYTKIKNNYSDFISKNIKLSGNNWI